jgi:hypothetical protein
MHAMDEMNNEDEIITTDEIKIEISSEKIPFSEIWRGDFYLLLLP